MFILAVGIGLIFFYVVAQKTIDSSSQERMKTNVARQSEHLRTILNIHYSYLEGVAEKIAESNELMNEENKEVLTVFQKNTSLDRLALIDPEGNAYYDNGVEKNVSHRRYFKEGISGNRTLSDPLESSVDQETRVVLGVPVFHEDEVIGILCGSCNVGELSQMLFDDLFSGNGYSLIVTREGKIVAHTGDAVLHTFGALLGRQFRGDDIVGRIGGDEFIILMRNVTTKEAVRTKAEQLLAETKKLVFDEMAGRGITISVGIALAPEHGKTYLNLYRSADQALYETKRNGRNGFTIYGENRDITGKR